MTQTPVCIIGAGPAGLTASLFLSRMGVEHILVERSAFPRDKVCGESFDGKVFHLLNRLDPDWQKEMDELGMLHRCRAYSLTNSRGYKLSIRFPDQHTPKLHIKRKEFDAFLLEKARLEAPCTVFLQTRAQKIIRKEDGVLIKTDKGTIQSRLLIISSGATSLIGAKEKKKEQKNNRFLFARAYFEGLPPAGEKPELEIFFLRRPFKGCLLFCPLADGQTNVEIGMEQREWKRSRRPLNQLLQETLRQDPFRRRIKEARPLSTVKTTAMTLSTARRSYSVERCLLAGSAAGSVNPVTGFGVGHAMSMGKLAAEQAALALETDDYSASFLKAYDRKVRKKLGREIFLSHLVTHLQKHIDVLEPIIYLMSRGRVLSDILSDHRLIQNLFNPLFYWRHWRSAISRKKHSGKRIEHTEKI